MSGTKIKKDLLHLNLVPIDLNNSDPASSAAKCQCQLAKPEKEINNQGASLIHVVFR